MLVQDSPLRAHYVMIPARFPERIVERIDPASLPADWRDISGRGELQPIGAKWSQTRTSAVLAVPSAVVPAEFNYLLNPDHPDFVHVEIGAREAWSTDPRLLRRVAAPE
jgi:RES domain-containing protein